MLWVDILVQCVCSSSVHTSEMVFLQGHFISLWLSSAMPTSIPPLILDPTQVHTSQMSVFSGAPAWFITILFGSTDWRWLCGSAGCGFLASDSTPGSGLGCVLPACSSPSAGSVFYSIQPCRLQEPSSYPAPWLDRGLLWTAIWEKRREGEGVGVNGKDHTSVVLEIWNVVKEHSKHYRPKNPLTKYFNLYDRQRQAKNSYLPIYIFFYRQIHLVHFWCLYI